MPRSILLGRQRTSVTTYEYDDKDRLVRSVTVHDAEWAEEDLAYAQAKHRNDIDKCPGGCGLPLSETTDPDNEGAYESPLPVRCHACTPMGHRQQEYRESPSGLLFRVMKRIKHAVSNPRSG